MSQVTDARRLATTVPGRRRWRPGAVIGLAAALATAGPVAAPADAQGRIMIIGDSIQSGTGLRRVTQQASHRLQRSLRIVVHNFASPGARMTDVFPFAGMHQAVTAVWLLHGFFGMQGLVVALGTNDWTGAVDLATFRQVYAAFLADIPPRLPRACLGPTWRTAEEQPNANGDTLDDFREAIRVVCTSAGGTFLDGRAAIPNDLDHFPDGLHPNERGHRAMAKFLATELKRLGWVP